MQSPAHSRGSVAEPRLLIPVLGSGWRVRYGVPALAVLFLTLAGSALHRELAAINLADVAAHIAELSSTRIAIALLLTAASYATLMLYDGLGLRYLRVAVPATRVALTSFIAYAFAHNISLAAFTGAGVRYRLYSAFGLGFVQVGALVTFCGVTSFLGVTTLAGVSMLVSSSPLLDAISVTWRLSSLVGLLLLLLPATYLAWSAWSVRTFRFRAFELGVPGFSVALSQLLAGCVDLGLAAAVLWTLLPAGAADSYLQFVGLYALAIIAGVLSNVPGGLGVFETILMLALRNVPRDQLIGALLVYRAIYYLLPLLLAGVLLAGSEIRRRRQMLQAVARIAGLYATPIASRAGALLAFAAGTVLLLSGAIPAVSSRLHVLRHVVPLPLLELSHLAASVVGLALLLLARGLQRRLTAAYHVTSALLVLGVVASLLKGLDVEEAAILAAVLLLLYLGRAAFYRRSRLLDERFSARWIAAVLAVVGLSTGIAMLSTSTVYSNDLWWTFALSADLPRVLRAALGVMLLSVIVLCWHLMRPGSLPRHDPKSLDLDRARRAISMSDESQSNAALTGDKRLLFHGGTDAFLMYQVSGRSWIALGDPIGPATVAADLAWAFRESVDRADGRVVFYQVGTRHLPLYVDMGMTLLKLGEEARVPLEHFTLDGGARAELRQSHRRATRGGVSFEVIEPCGVMALLPALSRISDAWLKGKASAEKGFSVGRFSADYLQGLPVALVRCKGEPVAFANLWPTTSREELSIDLMRFADDAPRNTMDYLFVELMLWARQQGFRWFNLGMAPLAGLQLHALAPAWHRVGGFVFRHGEHFFNFEGLRFYKEKFQPQWQPRYLATESRLGIAPALFDSSRLIAGGLGGLVRR